MITDSGWSPTARPTSPQPVSRRTRWGLTSATGLVVGPGNALLNATGMERAPARTAGLQRLDTWLSPRNGLSRARRPPVKFSLRRLLSGPV
jgi:hypothetical protein